MGCSSLLYYPMRQQIYDPKKFKLDYEEVSFENKEHQKIFAWWFPSRKIPAKGTFVFFHGNGENLSTHFLSLGWLPDLGYNYFIFDYPGYGRSEGDPDPYSCLSSGMAALQWVHDNKDPKPLIVYGHSMGGITAMRAVIEKKNEIPIKAMIADGTFSSYRSLGRQKLSESWVTWLFQPLAYVVLSDKWAPDVSKISPIPLIVLHGKKDPLVPFKNGERIFAEAGEPKVFYPVEEGHHGDLFWVEGQKYQKIVLSEIEKEKGNTP